MKKNILILLIAALTISCTHRHNDSPITYLEQNFKRKFNFQKGSYWIYKDSLTGVLDSFIVADKQTAFTGPSPNYDMKYENIYISLQEQTPGKSYSSQIILNLESYSGISFSFGTSNAPNNLFGFGHIGYPFVDFNSTNSNSQSSQFHLPSPYTVAGNDFEQVTEFFQGSTTDHSRDSWCYMNDSVGIIKIHSSYMDINGAPSTKILELQRWNIIK